MPVDLACPNCREPVQVGEHAPLCPRCGTDLQDTRLTETAAQQNEETVGEDDFAGLHVVDSGAQPPDFSALSAETERPAQENPVSMAPASDPDAGRDRPLSDFTTPETAPAEPLVESAVESAAEPAKIVRESAAGAPAVSRRLYFIVLTYAILATLLLAGHLVLLRTRGPHQLESLPDIVPNYRDTLPDLEPTLNKQGQVIRQIVPRDALLPPGHTLALGQSQRFGNVRVTPLKVTREMLRFAHYSGDAARTRSAEGPVLKLWLKFENLSEDQVFAPLDRELLYFRGRTSADSFELRANNFLVGRDNPRQPVLVYDLALDGEWDPQGQSLGTFASPRLLEPGAELVTYVPTQPEGIEDLQGDLVWRVHIRKGYHPESGRGVTTLIEVAFENSKIETQG